MKCHVVSLVIPHKNGNLTPCASLYPYLRYYKPNRYKESPSFILSRLAQYFLVVRLSPSSIRGSDTWRQTPHRVLSHLFVISPKHQSVQPWHPHQQTSKLLRQSLPHDSASKKASPAAPPAQNNHSLSAKPRRDIQALLAHLLTGL